MVLVCRSPGSCSLRCKFWEGEKLQREREREMRDETEMVSIATATLKNNLNKWGWDKEQTAASEPVK